MDTKISISSFSSIFPEDFDFTHCTYEEALDYFEKYKSLKEARKDGYEAHHIIPVSIQVDIWSKKLNRKMTRASLYKEGLIDDTCVRCTPLDHLLLHYIASRNLGGEYRKIFEDMIRFSYKKIPDNAVELLESLSCWAEERKKAREYQSHLFKEKYSSLSEEEKKQISELRRKSFAPPEVREHFSKARKDAWERSIKEMRSTLTDEENNNLSDSDIRKIISKNIKKAFSNPECRENLSKGVKRYFDCMTIEEKESFCKMRSEVANRPDIKESVRQKLKEYYGNMTEEERQSWVRSMKEGWTEEAKQKRLETWNKNIDNIRESIRVGTNNYYQNTPGARQKTSEATKIAMNTPEMINIRENIKRDYEKQKLELGKDYIRWNQFQKIWFEQNNRGE